MSEPESIFDYALSEHAQRRIRERGIKTEWLKQVLAYPQDVTSDKHDARLTHRTRPIQENDGRVLRVVYNHSVEPPVIVTAFFDRRL